MLATLSQGEREGPACVSRWEGEGLVSRDTSGYSIFRYLMNGVSSPTRS